MSDLRTFTLDARKLLTQEAGDLLEQVYRLDARTGARLPIPQGHPLESSAAVKANRQRIEKLLNDEVDAGLTRVEAVSKLTKETAFTHLNRFVAFKLLEANGLRSPLDKHHASNGFRMWLGVNSDAEVLYNQGDNPNDRDEFGEAPRDRAYRQFLLWQCGQLAEEINVLFDPENLPSLLFPRPAVLRQLIDALNADDRKQDWKAGNEETVGWVYQFFNAEEKAAAFDKVFKKKKKFDKTDLPAATQIFTPRWVVRFLVENSLGRLWLSMHPASHFRESLAYLVPLPVDPPAATLKPVKEIRVLDPATGTMHFGLVAFDLLAEMYREELANAGTPGWPAQASIQSEAEIPAAILANNLFGIDIDLRAVQLAALALYLKAKATNKQAVLKDSNLACADVAIFRGQHLTKITSEMALPGGFTRELFTKFRDNLEEASMMGSLVRLDRHFQHIQSDRLRQSIDAYVGKKREEGVDESYFADETAKGLRLLNVLERRYDIVFTNPPYMSNRNMNPTMSDFMKQNYPKSKGDLYSSFIERCAELLAQDGRLAMIAQQSFMYISSFEKLRELLLGVTAIEAMAHLGPRAFAEVTGEKVNTVAFVLRREQLEMERRGARAVYFRLVKEADAASKRTGFELVLTRYRAGEPDVRAFEYRQGDFTSIPGSPWAYQVPGSLRRLFNLHKSLSDIYPTKHGLTSGDNGRFIRYWWEVGASRVNRSAISRLDALKSKAKWFPLVKSASKGNWRGLSYEVLNYFSNGAELIASRDDGTNPGHRHDNPDTFFQAGVAFPLLSSSGMSSRVVDAGSIYDVSAPFVLTESGGLVSAFLNSSLASYLLMALNPTLNFPPGDVGRLPLLTTKSETISNLVNMAVEQAEESLAEDETTPQFSEPPLWPNGVESVALRQHNLLLLERSIDEEIYRLYDSSNEDRKTITEELSAAQVPDDQGDEGVTRSEESIDAVDGTFSGHHLARLWISYAVGIALGRFVRAGLEHLVDADGLMVVYADHPDDLAKRVIDILAAIHTDVEASRIVRTAIGGNGDLRDEFADYLLGRFFKQHVKQYRKRPVYWLIQSRDQKYSVYLFHERATDQTLSLLQGTRYLGGRLHQLKEQSDKAKQKEMTSEGKEKAQWKRKAQEAAEEWADLDALRKAIDDTNAEPITTAAGQPATAHWVPEFDDGVLLNAAPLYRLTPAWRKADAKLDLRKAWDALKTGEYPWAKTAMRYWPRETLAACKDNKSYRIAHGLE